MTMSERQASVILSPIGAPGPEPSLIRTFTLSSRQPVFEIGRSSKREAKKRTPDKDNGWFDSRVMSRDHAELGFDLDQEKRIYVRDFGSTHGTWLNDVKLVTGEATTLLSGDILRFGVDVDRGDEEFPALSVRCDITWSESAPDLEDRPRRPWDMISNNAAEPALIAVDSKPTSGLRPCSSTNTFCVPDDDESDLGEIKTKEVSCFKVGDEDITVLYDETKQDTYQEAPVQHELSLSPDSHLSDCENAVSRGESYEQYSESSNEGESDFDSDPSSYSQESEDEQVADHFDYFHLPIPLSEDGVSSSEAESDAESQSGSDDGYSIKQDEEAEECIDPTMLTHKDDVKMPSRDEYIQTLHQTGFTIKQYTPETQMKGPVLVQNQQTTFPFPSHFPLTPTTPLVDEKREEDDGTQNFGRLSIRDMLNNYRDGPFAGPSDSTQKEACPGENAGVEFPSPAPLKRKAFDMESQDAQIQELIVPPSEKSELETISQSQVAEAISSALSESSHSEPPKKRVKTTHDPSNKLASYTATAIISALLGGLGTIALLAALPPEYFQ